MAEGWVIVATDSQLNMEVIGTRTGRPYTTEAAAERHKAVMDRTNPKLDFVVIPISTYPH